MSRYRFIQAEQATFPIATLCRVLQVARSGYYAWTRRGAWARAQANERHCQLGIRRGQRAILGA